MIRGVPTVPGQFEMRKLMPAAWAGREFEELDAATQAGVRGALKEHKRVAHPHSERALLSDSETPTSWLNGEETIRKDH